MRWLVPEDFALPLHAALWQCPAALTHRGDADTTVDITDQLQEEIDTDWTWANHPMTWLDRDEIRIVSADAQKIHDGIASGLLGLHLHAHDGHTTCAVGTYQHADSVHLHGENHLRVVSGSHTQGSHRRFPASVRRRRPSRPAAAQQH